MHNIMILWMLYLCYIYLCPTIIVSNYRLQGESLESISCRLNSDCMTTSRHRFGTDSPRHSRCRIASDASASNRRRFFHWDLRVVIESGESKIFAYEVNILLNLIILSLCWVSWIKHKGLNGKRHAVHCTWQGSKQTYIAYYIYHIYTIIKYG
jgi:hypothetical protein